MTNNKRRYETCVDDLTSVAEAICHLHPRSGSSSSPPSCQELKEPPRKRQVHRMEQLQCCTPPYSNENKEPEKTPLLHKWEDLRHKSIWMPTKSKRTNQGQQNIKQHHDDEPVELRNIDVLSGRGGESNSHRGNRRYWEILLQYRPEYQSIPTRNFDKKQQIANQVYSLVCEGGTRFIKRNKESGLLEEQPENDSLEKVKQCLRSRYKPLFHTETKSNLHKCIAYQEDRSVVDGKRDYLHVAEPGKDSEGSKRPPAANTLQIVPGRKMARGHTTPSCSSELNVVSEHSATMSQQQISARDADVRNRPGEVPEGWKDSSLMKCLEPPVIHERSLHEKVPNIPTLVFGLKSCDKSDDRIHAQNHSVHDEDDGSHLLSRSQTEHAQQVYVSFRDDEELDRLGDIPEDIPCQPGKEWLSDPDIARPCLGDQVIKLVPTFPKLSSSIDFIDNDDLGAAGSPLSPLCRIGCTSSSQQNHACGGAYESQQLELKEIDVLSGQGSGSANRPGNQRYLKKVRTLQHAYWSLADRDLKGKTELAREVYSFVSQSGGRFVQKRFPLDLYVVELSKDKALKKIRRALRDGKPSIAER